MNKQLDKIYEDVVAGKEVDISDANLTLENAKHIFGKAKEYRREGEFFELQESNADEATRCYNICARLEKLSQDIKETLK